MKITLILPLAIASNKKAHISKHSLQWCQGTKNHNAKPQHLKTDNAGKNRGRLKEVLQRDVHKKDSWDGPNTRLQVLWEPQVEPN